MAEGKEIIALCRVVLEAGPINAFAMVGEFMPLVKRGFITGQGYLSTKGKEFLEQHNE